MKLYSYSSKMQSFVEVKWVTTKFLTGGILFGIVILFGVVKLNQYIRDETGYRSTNTLAAENKYLSQQVSMISSRVGMLKRQVSQLNESADRLDMYLQRPQIVGDTVSKFMNAANELNYRFMIPAVKSFSP